MWPHCPLADATWIPWYLYSTFLIPLFEWLIYNLASTGSAQKNFNFFLRVLQLFTWPYL